MSEAKQCAQCGRELAPGVPEGLCPACLLAYGLETQSAAGTGAAGFTPPTPEELERYFPQLEILELLGRGGMGMVYKARQRKLDRLVALKILAAPADGDPAFAERFAREAVALARLSHPHIVAVHDLGRTDGGLYYFLMEYVDGVNVRQLLNAAQITPPGALAIIPQICEALQYAHDQGIVHRDIKPENILIDRGGRVKIADFGLAKIVGCEAGITLTSSGATMGTPVYMAPEQIERPQEVDHRADIYSVGVVFYQMLTGELPMGRFAPPSKKVQIDVRLDEVVLRALEKEPDLRWQQAGDVKTEVETIASTPPPGDTGAERQESHVAEGAQPAHTAGAGEGWGLMKKNHAWLVTAAMILIAAGIAIFVYELGNKGTPKFALNPGVLTGQTPSVPGGMPDAPQSPPPVAASGQLAGPTPAVPAPVPQDQQETVALLLSGKWNIEGTDRKVWYVAVFHEDKSVSIDKVNGGHEIREWSMDGKLLSIIYPNHRDIFFLPLDPNGTKGQGRTLPFIAVKVGAEPGDTSTATARLTAAERYPKIDLDLPANSTIGDLIALLKKNQPQYGYAISSPKLNDVKLGEIKLRGATLVQLAEALNAAGNGEIAVMTDFSKTLYFREPRAQGVPAPSIARRPKIEFIDLDLPANGTLGDLIAILKTKYPQYAVNVSSDSLNGVKLGEIKLRRAYFSEVAATLRIAGLGHFTATGGNNTLYINEIKQPTPIPAAAGHGDQPIINIDLPPDGTIKDLIAFLKANYPQMTCNVSSPRLYDVKIGELRLREVPLAGLGGAFTLAGAGREGGFMVGVQSNMINFTDMREKAVQVSAFNIGPWIGDMPDDAASKKALQLDDMIKGTIQMLNSIDVNNSYVMPKCTYLPATKMYVIAGHLPSVQAANMILKVLVPKVVPAENPSPAPTAAPQTGDFP